MVGGELGAVQSRDLDKHLLGRITAPVDDHEVIPHRFGENVAQGPLDLGRPKREGPARDGDGTGCLYHGFSDLSLKPA
jgi:hypothetical protein